MSRSQHPNYPSQGTSRLSGGRPPPPHRRTADTPQVTDVVVTSRENPSQVIIGSSGHWELFAVTDLQQVKRDINDNTALIKDKLTCRLTKAQQDIKKDLYNDIDGIQKVIVGVMEAHRAVANTIRHTMRLQGSTRTHDVHKLLEPALKYIDVASTTLSRLTWNLTVRSDTMRAQVDPSAGPIKALWHCLVNYHVPEAITGTGYTLALSSAIDNSANSIQIGNHQISATVVQTTLAVGSVVVSSTMARILNYLGREADIYRPEARKTTKDALICVHALVYQLAEVLGSLDSYWNYSHGRLIHEGLTPADRTQLIQIAGILDQHVDDCLDMAISIQRNIPLAGNSVLPTRTQLDQERKAHTNGIPALPFYGDRCVTHGGNYFM